MELSEVVNPHFAFPVVGVVICAVLVFAFGFKSPVQPPSFDFSPEVDRRGKKKTKKSKPQSNGHVVAIESSPTTKQATPKAQATSKSEKSDTPKAKSKKASRTPKVQPQLEATKEVNKDSFDDGEWTTALSKKEKKLRKLAPEEPSQDKKEEPKKAEVVAAPETESAPQEQRSKKASPRNKKDGKPQKAAPVKDVQVENKSNDKPAVEKPTAAPAPAVEAKTSPKKSKKKPKAADAAASPEKAVDAAPSAEVKAPQPAPKSAKNEAQASKAKPSADDSAGFQEVKSPKTKKKKSKESRENYPELDQVVASQTSSQGDSSTKNISFTKDGASRDEKSQNQSISKGAGDASEPSQSTTSGETAAGSLQFDDMGDWQDAKPVKKKKKARREN